VARVRPGGDRLRFLTAAALLRLAAAACLSVAPDRLRVDRRCERCGTQHGRPRLPDHPGVDVSVATFLGLWTRKESIVKALGTGITDDFARVSPAASGAALRPLTCGPGYVATLAILGRCDHISELDGAALLVRRPPVTFPSSRAMSSGGVWSLLVTVRCAAS
jgi:phosphopantetheinyl transferase